MTIPTSVTNKIKNALRIDRAFALVWKASKKWTILGALLTVISGLLPLVALYILKLIIDTITDAVQTGAGGESFNRIIFLICCATLVGVFQAAIRQLSLYIQEAQASVVTDYVSAALHEQSISLDLAYYENPKYYDTLHRAQREGPYRPTRIVNGLTRLLQNIVSLAAMVGLLFTFHWAVGILLFVSTIPGIFVQIFHAKKSYNWRNKRTPEERKAGYFSTLLTLDAFAKEIRLFNLGQFFSDSFNSLKTLLRTEKLTLSRSKGMWEFIAQAFAAIVLMGSLLLITFRALSGAITIGDMVMFFQAFQRGITYLKELLQNIASLYEDNLFIAYLFEFLDIPQKIIDPPRPEVMPSSFTSGVELSGVSFKYPGERSGVLKDISLRIGPHEVVALVGANGAGKSTLVKLLCRLYDPAGGTITIDGNKLEQYRVEELRKQISVVFQDYAKYYLTAQENIMLGDIEASADTQRVKEAALKADADAFIQKLPKGYDTVLGRWFLSGEELSLGEWQKIVLARAFLRESPLIILDEPTSSMDIHTEYHLYTKFKQLMQGRSALIISHRFSTVRMADRIYVLDDGRICEEGSHEDLVAAGGVYAGMYAKVID